MLEDSPVRLQRVREDFKYVLAESGFPRRSRWRSGGSNYLFLCDSVRENELLMRLFCRYVRRRLKVGTPVVSLTISDSHSPHQVVRNIVVALQASTRDCLDYLRKLSLDHLIESSPGNLNLDLSLDGLTTFDLKMLITETIKGFNRTPVELELVLDRPVFVSAFTSVGRTEPNLSTLNFLRSIISEGWKPIGLSLPQELSLILWNPLVCHRSTISSPFAIWKKSSSRYQVLTA
jgi:hypothetical protein